MSDIPRANIGEYTVSQLSAALRRTVEDTYGHVRLRGEISGYRGPHASGHCYFALKDEGARIEAVIWKGQFGRLRVRPEEGMEVVAIGRLTTYAGTSKYQIVIESLELAGLGALMALMEKRKQALAAEGLFDPARKQLLPYLPAVIGVVTSPTGAVIRDILHRLADRFPRHVLVWPARVQGDGAAEQIAAAIRGFNALPQGGPIPRPDVLIVARGGGSLEDLWCFNEEIVVRAAADSDIPLISAVGHETDVTLIDFAADRRAPTPTAAAEMVVPVRLELVARIEDAGRRALTQWMRCQDDRRAEFRSAARALPAAERLLAAPRQRLDAAAAALPRALIANARLHERAFGAVAQRLHWRMLQGRLAQQRTHLSGIGARHAQSLAVSLHRRRDRFASLETRFDASLRALIAAHRTAIAHRKTRLGLLGDAMGRCFGQTLTARHNRLAAASGLLAALSYRGVLARGYAVIRDAQGAPLRSAAAVAAEAAVEIEMADGRVTAHPATAAAATPRPAPRKPGAVPPKQKSLFD